MAPRKKKRTTRATANSLAIVTATAEAIQQGVNKRALNAHARSPPNFRRRPVARGRRGGYSKPRQEHIAAYVR